MHMWYVCVCICDICMYVCVFMTLLVLTTPYAAIKTLIHIHLYQYIHNHVTEDYFMLRAVFKHKYVIVTVVRTVWSFYLYEPGLLHTVC